MPRRSHSSGFTLIEVLVASTITIILASALLVISGNVLDVYTRSTSRLESSAHARIAFETLTQELEEAVLRSDTNMWILAQPVTSGPSGFERENTRLRFFTTPPEYSNTNSQGSLCAVTCALNYDNIFGTTSTEPEDESFALYRQVLDPETTFNDIISADLDSAWSSYSPQEEDILVENIVGFNVVFWFRDNTSGILYNSDSSDDFIYANSQVEANTTLSGSATNATLIYADVTLTVLDSEGNRLIEIFKKNPSRAPSDLDTLDKLITRFGYTFSKRVDLSSE